ncbi:hypothetical protein Syun_011862 [Stephania yunnanensis]|uniref:Uncharacterized protein n=1 Tax=Stephania yunnanensis TaxID=152371 RepID=A0AAP0PFV5_9MAGN
MCCCPGVPFTSSSRDGKDFYLYMLSQRPRMVELMNLQVQVAVVDRGCAVAATSIGGGGGGGVGAKQQCLCSPTKHPGSFRCRHHHGEYQWRGRLVRAKPYPGRVG